MPLWYLVCKYVSESEISANISKFFIMIKANTAGCCKLVSSEIDRNIADVLKSTMSRYCLFESSKGRG
jgi:hypothetical protein